MEKIFEEINSYYDNFKYIGNSGLRGNINDLIREFHKGQREFLGSKDHIVSKFLIYEINDIWKWHIRYVV